jgi:FAD/FMN-containing dehydrogenase
MKLHPLPAAQLTAFAACHDLTACVALLELARRHLGATLTGFEVMGAAALDLVAKHFPQLPRPLPAAAWTVLLECADAHSETQARERVEALLQAAIEQHHISDAVLAESMAQARALWHVRESIPLAQSLEGPNIKHDIALPVSAIAAFVQRTDAALQAAFPGSRVINFGHLGDGNLHYNLQAAPDVQAQDFLDQHEAAVNRIVYDAVAACDGSISAEHGIGALKRDELHERKSPVALAMMKAIKQALDPKGTLNPGRVL